MNGDCFSSLVCTYFGCRSISRTTWWKTDMFLRADSCGMAMHERFAILCDATSLARRMATRWRIWHPFTTIRQEYIQTQMFGFVCLNSALQIILHPSSKIQLWQTGYWGDAVREARASECQWRARRLRQRITARRMQGMTHQPLSIFFTADDLMENCWSLSCARADNPKQVGSVWDLYTRAYLKSKGLKPRVHMCSQSKLPCTPCSHKPKRVIVTLGGGQSISHINLYLFFYVYIYIYMDSNSNGNSIVQVYYIYVYIYPTYSPQ